MLTLNFVYIWKISQTSFFSPAIFYPNTWIFSRYVLTYWDNTFCDKLKYTVGFFLPTFSFIFQHKCIIWLLHPIPIVAMQGVKKKNYTKAKMLNDTHSCSILSFGIVYILLPLPSTVFIYGKCYGYKHVHVQKIMYGLYLWMFFERFFFLNLKKNIFEKWVFSC